MTLHSPAKQVGFFGSSYATKRGPAARAGFALGDLLHDIGAGKSLKIPGRPADDDEWGVIKVSAMTWGEFDERYEIEPGDLLLSRANTLERVGAAVLVDRRDQLLLTDKSMWLLTTPWGRPAMVAMRLGSPALREQVSAVASGNSDLVHNISRTNVRAGLVRAPAASRR